MTPMQYIQECAQAFVNSLPAPARESVARDANKAMQAIEQERQAMQETIEQLQKRLTELEQDKQP